MPPGTSLMSCGPQLKKMFGAFVRWASIKAASFVLKVFILFTLFVIVIVIHSVVNFFQLRPTYTPAAYADIMDIAIIIMFKAVFLSVSAFPAACG